MPVTSRAKERLRTVAFYEGRKKQAEARRGLYTALMFWKACGHKQCLRARACAAKAFDCSERLWPIVPERLKIGIRAAGKAAEARLSKAETEAMIKSELARWDETMARIEALQAQYPASAAEPAPQSAAMVPEMKIPSAPRIRSL